MKLIFAAATGVRAGELHALRWKHINFARREVRIETRVDPYGDEDVPKTIAGMRTIPLGENVLAALKAWRLRSPFSKRDDLVFPNAPRQLLEPRRHGEAEIPAAVRSGWPQNGRKSAATNRSKSSPGTRCGISRSHAGSMRGCRPRPSRPSRAIAACR